MAPPRKHDRVMAEVVRVMSGDPAASYAPGEILDRLEAAGAGWFDRGQARAVRVGRLNTMLWKEGRRADRRVAADGDGRYRLPWPLRVAVGLDEEILRTMLSHPGTAVALPHAQEAVVRVEAATALDRGGVIRVLIDAIYELTHTGGTPKC